MNDRPEELPVEDSDDEALSWAGDEDLGRTVTSARRRRSGSTSADDAADSAEDDLDGDADILDLGEAEPGRRAATVVAAILYLLVAVGWVMSVQYTSSGSSQVLVDLPWQFGEFMAMASGPLLFFAVRQLTADRPLRFALIGWIIGIVVLLPWPILVLLSRGAV